jgi:protein required for attachment to host cells
MTDQIPHNALIVVADGAGARFFRNVGQVFDVALKADGALGPSDLNGDGPSGKRPPEETGKENDEATFAKQLAHDLYRRAHLGEFAALVLIADPQTLGQIRPQLHKEVQSRLVGEHAKTMTKASIADIEKLLG